MDTIKENAYAKLNLTLDITGAREDGYHDMVMVMQTISLHDELEIEITGDGSVTASANLAFIPGDERNLAVKAAKLFFERAGINDGARIKMDKKIPVGAGMAGGSSDAAAVLRALNRYYGSPLSQEEMMELAGGTGSDVAFCYMGGTALAKGRGEVLTPLKSIPECQFVVAKPQFSIATPELFKAIDKMKLRVHPDTDGILKAIDEGNLVEISRRMYNVFEDVPDRRMKTTAEIKSRLLEAGALGAIMTGTGSAVFGIFAPDSKTAPLRAELEKEYGFACEARKAN